MIQEHYLELRKRIIHSIIFIASLFSILLFYAKPLYHFIATPILERLPPQGALIATQVTAPFIIPMKLSFLCAIVLGMPFILYQFWAFISPGLYTHEKRKVLPIMLSSISLFYLGLIFAFTVIGPMALLFFTQQVPPGVQIMTDMSYYFDFLLMLLIATGLAFQIPIITVGVIKLGIVQRETLIKQRAYVIVGSFVLGMLLTPPDVLSQVLLAVPMWLLFELGIFFTKFKN